VSVLWGIALVVAVTWPSRVIGPLDGAPFDTPLELIALGVVLPAVWWLHPSFLKTTPARVMVVLLLAWKAAAWVALPQGGWCGDLVMNQRPETGGWRLMRSWDARMIAQPTPPHCTAVVARGYSRPTHFPAWMINIPYGQDRWLDTGGFISTPLANPRPPAAAYRFFVNGALDVAGDGTLSIETDTDTALTGAVDGRAVAAEAGRTATIQVARGTHIVDLRLDLVGRNWRFVPRWNGADAFASAVTTFSPVSGAVRAVHRYGGWLAPTLVVVLLAWWTASAVAIDSPGRLPVAAIGAIAAAMAWAGSAGMESALPRYAVAALALCAIVPMPARVQNVRGAWLVVGAPWLALIAAMAMRNAGRFTLFFQGDDPGIYQQFAYRIFMERFWLEGGQPTFWNQPLYRWICGALHVLFGDSSAGEMVWDGFGLLAGSMFAFVVVNRFAGFRSGVAAAIAVLMTFALGPNWYVIGRGLSEISALLWVYLASCCVIASSAGSPALALLGGLFGVLGYYTRMNLLPLTLALGALTLGDGIDAGSAFQLRRVWARVPIRAVVNYYAVVAAGLCAFAARTWYYTGRFSLFAGTTLGFNSIGLGTTLESWWSADTWKRAAASVLMLVTVQDPPRFDVRSVLVVAGVALSVLALVRVPVARRLPLGLVLICIAAISGGFVVRGSAYPGRFSIHLIPVAVTVSMLMASFSVRSTSQWRRAS